MPELVLMPPSPNKHPQPAASGKKPAAPQSSKRLSIKDYFSVAADSPASPMANASKKRKPTGDDPAPAAKKPRKPAATKAKKTAAEPAVAASSDKENGDGVAELQDTVAAPATLAKAKPKAPRKPRVPKGTEGGDAKGAAKETAKGAAKETAKGTAKKKEKEKEKETEKANQEAEDAALAAQLAREEVEMAAASPAPKFKAINVFKAVTLPKEKASPFREVNPGKASLFKAVNPAVQAMKAKAKEMSSRVTDVQEEEKQPKELKVLEKPVVPRKRQQKPREPKKTAAKAPKGVASPRVSKSPRVSQSPKLKNRADKRSKAGSPKADTSPGGTKKARGTGTEIKEWRQYQPKGSPGKPGIARFLKPVEQIRPPPKLEPCPELEHIEISYPLGVVQDRLVIREFFLRFEKALKIVPKYVSTVNNPNSDWTDLTYRSVVLCILRLLHADNDPEIDWEVLDAGIKDLEKTAPDDPGLWTSLCTILEGFIDEDEIADADFSKHKPRLALIVKLIGLATGSEAIKGRIDNDIAASKKEEKDCQLQIKEIRMEWEAARQEITKQRLTATPEEKEVLLKRFHTEQAYMRDQVALLEARSWFKKRKLQPRQRPLGIDAKGNTYWLFIQRDKTNEDWGRWIVIERAPDLPHPSGAIPPHLITAPAPAPPPSSPPSSPPDTDTDIPPHTTSEADIRKRTWYAISTSTEAAALAKWIKSTAEMVFYERATKAAVEAAARIGSTPKRQRLKAVEVPMSPEMAKVLKSRGKGAARKLGVSVVKRELVGLGDPGYRGVLVEGVDREGVEELCKAVLKVGVFWELEESGVGKLK